MHDRARLERLVVRVLGESISSLEEPSRQELVDSVVAIVQEEVARERERAVQLCRGRADLWSRTIASTIEGQGPAREEARSRANEAKYLADLIELDHEPPQADA